MRALIKTAIAAAANRSGAARMLARWNGSAAGPLVLGYHRVVQEFAPAAAYSIPSMLVTVRMLEKHLDWVGRRFRFATLDEIATRLKSGVPFEHPTAAVTFDDGYADVYHNAFPMMRRKGIPGAVFVVTDLVASGQPQQHDALYLLLNRTPERKLFQVLRGLRLEIREDTLGSACQDPFQATSLLLQQLRQAEVHEVIRRLQAAVDVDFNSLPGLKALDWNMISEMHAGGFTIGSHTRSHALLINESPASVAEELRGSLRSLQAGLGAPARHLAYPDGRFNPAVVDAAVAAGYRFGYTICPHSDAHHPLMTIRRRMLWEKSCVGSRGEFSADVMACQIAGAFDVVAPCTGRHESAPAAPTATPSPAYEHVENN